MKQVAKPETKDDKRSEEQAQAQLESIKEMVAALTEAEEKNDDEKRDEAQQTIHEDALSIEVRSGWHTPGDEEAGAEEYRILLCTGGPACQIVGELHEHSEPCNATIQHQDWFTPWRELQVTDEDQQIILRYARCFYFGE